MDGRSRCYRFPVLKAMGVKIDAHVKSPFYMDLGIQGFRNLGIANYCRQLALKVLLKIPNFPTFYETIKIAKLKKGGLRHSPDDTLGLCGEPEGGEAQSLHEPVSSLSSKRASKKRRSAKHTSTTVRLTYQCSGRSQLAPFFGYRSVFSIQCSIKIVRSAISTWQS